MGAVRPSPVTREVLDFSEPVGLILVSVLPFLTDEDKPDEVLATLLDALPSGSYLAATAGWHASRSPLHALAATE